MSSVFRICLWAVVALLLAAVLVVGLGGTDLIPWKWWNFDLGNMIGPFNWVYADAEEYAPGGTSLSASGIDTIDVDWLSGAINIRVADVNAISFHETASRDLDENEQLHYRVKNGRLTIQYCQSRRGVSFRFPSKSLEVVIPRSMALKDLRVASVSSTVTVHGSWLNVQGVRVESVSGAITLSDLVTRELDVETVSGRIDMAGSFDEIDVDAVSGSVMLRLYDMPSRANFNSVSGSVSITVPENSGFTARLESVSGSVHCDFADTITRKQAVYGDGSAKFTVEAVSGNVTIDMDTSLRMRAPTAPEAPAMPSAPTPPPAPTAPPVPSSGRQF